MSRKPSKKTLKIRADKLFSEYIRSSGRCEWCGREPHQVQLQCAHIFPRRFLVTRWLPINAICLCAGCHRRGHDKPPEFVSFVKSYLGVEAYEDLMRTAKTVVHKLDVQKVIDDIKNNKPPYENL